MISSSLCSQSDIHLLFFLSFLSHLYDCVYSYSRSFWAPSVNLPYYRPLLSWKDHFPNVTSVQTATSQNPSEQKIIFLCSDSILKLLFIIILSEVKIVPIQLLLAFWLNYLQHFCFVSISKWLWWLFTYYFVPCDFHVTLS